MRPWDFNTGAANLEDAMKTLEAIRSEIAAVWDDETHRKFEEAYLAPLEPRMRRLLDAIHRMAEVTSRAERECADY
jgi:uncharacterized protein YukE